MWDGQLPTQEWCLEQKIGSVCIARTMGGTQVLRFTGRSYENGTLHYKLRIVLRVWGEAFTRNLMLQLSFAAWLLNIEGTEPLVDIGKHSLANEWLATAGSRSEWRWWCRGPKAWIPLSRVHFKWLSQPLLPHRSTRYSWLHRLTGCLKFCWRGGIVCCVKFKGKLWRDDVAALGCFAGALVHLRSSASALLGLH